MAVANLDWAPAWLRAKQIGSAVSARYQHEPQFVLAVDRVPLVVSRLHIALARSDSASSNDHDAALRCKPGLTLEWMKGDILKVKLSDKGGLRSRYVLNK
jgi:hypothetical protein